MHIQSTYHAACKLSARRLGAGNKWGLYLETIESLLGVGLVGLLHQLCHLLRCAALALFVCWVYPVKHTHTYLLNLLAQVW